MLDVAPIRPFLFDYLQSAGVKWKKQGSGYVAKCIAHKDSNPSMAYYKGSHHVHCFACGFHQDIVGVHAELTGRSVKTDFKALVSEFTLHDKK